MVTTGTRGPVSTEEATERGAQANTLYITASNIGKVPEYNNSEDFGLYLERLEQYFIANFIEEGRKVADLLTVIGSQTYKTLRDLCDPELPKNKSYEDLCVLLKKQFSPQISIFRKRIEFYEARQNSSESVNEWYARIKTLAVRCNFGRLLEDVLRDKFIAGMKKGKILDHLCEEDAMRGLQDIIEIAVKKEANMKEQTTEEMHKMSCKRTVGRKEEFKKKTSKDERMKTTKDEEPIIRKCFVCGKVNHNFSNCKFKGYKCNNCGQEGHLAVVCKYKKNNYWKKKVKVTQMRKKFSYNVFIKYRDDYSAN